MRSSSRHHRVPTAARNNRSGFTGTEQTGTVPAGPGTTLRSSRRCWTGHLLPSAAHHPELAGPVLLGDVLMLGLERVQIEHGLGLFPLKVGSHLRVVPQDARNRVCLLYTS